MQLITFVVDDEVYGLDIDRVKEIKGWAAPRPMPNDAPYSLGIIELRGEVFSIYDMRILFGLDRTNVTSKHVVIFVSTGNETFGILVDAVTDILSIKEKEIQPIPAIDETGRNKLLTGMIRQDDRMVALMDITRLRNNDPERLVG